MTKIRFTIEQEDGVPAWVRSLLEESRDENSPPPTEPMLPRSPSVARIARKRGPIEAKVEVPRYRWNHAHAALVASREPYEATAADAGVIVTTTGAGARVLEAHAGEVAAETQP